MVDGVIVANKPATWTSHDVVSRMRRLANTKKVGHLGTLDPAATGVLPLVIGRATRLQRFFQRTDKVYEAVVRLGVATSTYDADGVPVGTVSKKIPAAPEIERALEQFRGRIMQTPPPVSAKKIGGQRAYKLVRQNIPVELKPVEVEVTRLDLLRIDGSDLELLIHCSAGLYVRSIAHDLGRALGCGAHLYKLRRTRSGGFEIESARTLDELGELAASGRLEEALIPAVELLPEFPAELVDGLTAGFIRQGRDFRVSPFRVRADTRYVKAVSADGELIAIGEARLPNVYHPVLVL